MPEMDSRDISIRENKGMITISGIQEQVVTNADEMMRCLEIGVQSRSTGDTQMNMHSSRSHAIFTISLEQRVKRNLNPVDMYHMVDEEIILKRSKLHLVDLAGISF
jgi:hypothetical protein